MDHVNEYFAGSSRVYAIDPRNKCAWRIGRCNTQCLDVCHDASWRASPCFLARRAFSRCLQGDSARSQGPVIFDTITTIYHLLMLTFVERHFISCSSSFHRFFQIFFHHGHIRFPTSDKSLGQHPESLKLGGSNSCEAR